MEFGSSIEIRISALGLYSWPSSERKSFLSRSGRSTAGWQWLRHGPSPRGPLTKGRPKGPLVRCNIDWFSRKTVFDSARLCHATLALHRARRRSGGECNCSLGFSRLTGTVRPAAISVSPSRADIARRGFAISFLTEASTASPSFFLAFLFIDHP
jgi:hypothetical protein